MLCASALLGLVLPPPPVNIVTVRAAVGVPTPSLLAAEKLVFPEEIKKSFEQNAPIVAEKLQKEVAPAVESGLKAALVEAQKDYKDAEPLLKQTAEDLAPIAAQAFEVVKPVVIKGVTVAGGQLWEFTKFAGKVALDTASVAAGEAGAALSKAVDEKVTEVAPDAKSTLNEGGKIVQAALPVLEEGVRVASPYVDSAVKAASKAGADALRSQLTKINTDLDTYAAPAAVPVASSEPSMADKLAAAEAERLALLQQLK
jgi:hypothetical protein